MDDMQFLTTKDVLGYAEEYIVAEKSQKLYNFSLSNSLDDIKTAIYARTGINFDLDNAYWQLSTKPATNIMELMNRHHTTYSMTTWYEDEKEKQRNLLVFMHVGNKWFSTMFYRNNRYIFNHEKYLIIKKILNLFDDETVINLLKDILE